MKKLVFFPSDPIEDYIKKGRTYEFLDEYYNPGSFFDEVYCLSPWGEKDKEKIGNICYIKADPLQFKEIIKTIKPDVVRGYGGYRCSDWVSISKVKGIPTVVSVHDTNPELIHESLKYADGIICMSQAVKDAVKKIVPSVTKNIWVMPNRIDTELFKKKEDKEYFNKLDEKFPGKFHVIHVGRKTKQKNLETVIKSMEYLDNGIVTVFIGQGDTDYYKKIAEDCGVTTRCFFVDRVESNDMPLWYSWCDCMCTPSRWEGFGYVFIEAAACEAAVITSNIGPMNEYLTNERNAILIDDYENPVEIANSIKKVLARDNKIEEMKENAREVGLRFKKSAIDEQEIEIYRKIFGLTANNKINNKLVKELTMEKKTVTKYIGVRSFLKQFKILHTVYRFVRNVFKIAWSRLVNYCDLRQQIKYKKKEIVKLKGKYNIQAVEIETVNRCNGECPFCPVNKNEVQRPYAKMSDKLFYKIIDNLAQIDYYGKISLYSNNEPFIDDRIIDFHKYANSKLPDAFFNLYTNGSLLTLDKFIEILDYVDYLVIDNYSDDGSITTPELKKIFDYITEHKEIESKVFFSFRKKNEVLTSRGGQAPNKQKITKCIQEICWMPFRQFVIRPTGEVSLCCNDALGKYTLGDLNTQSIQEIWNSKNIKEIRKHMLKYGRKGLKLCENCDTKTGPMYEVINHEKYKNALKKRK